MSDYHDPRYPGAPEGHDDPDSPFYQGHDGPIEVDGRIYDDRNPSNIRCTNPACRAAGDCYCGSYGE